MVLIYSKLTIEKFDIKVQFSKRTKNETKLLFKYSNFIILCHLFIKDIQIIEFGLAM